MKILLVTYIGCVVLLALCEGQRFPRPPTTPGLNTSSLNPNENISTTQPPSQPVISYLPPLPPTAAALASELTEVLASSPAPPVNVSVNVNGSEASHLNLETSPLNTTMAEVLVTNVTTSVVPDMIVSVNGTATSNLTPLPSIITQGVFNASASQPYKAPQGTPCAGSDPVKKRISSNTE